MSANSTQEAYSGAPPTTGVALPVVGRATVRRSSAGRWRATVLLAVHVLIAVHVAHWAGAGTTISPLEPSEAMEFSKHSVVNAGLIFFALTIISTALLGRWFCGWACHLVALQDLCRWLLGKLRIRPRPLRSSVLATVPLVAFLYMFVAPWEYRLLAGERLALSEWRLTTSAFWETFPGWLPAVLTFVVCGFVCVYFLGAKGFCTNACPYGAIFGAAEQFSSLRIRVTDACAGCGHCTAVCSSNVRVHDEVRDFGMVVDPGCMKCLDCVGACPTKALYFGRGRPALFRQRPPWKVQRGSLSSLIGYWLPVTTFAFVSFAVFTGSDSQRAFLYQPVDWIVFATLSALTLAILAVFRVRSSTKRARAPADEIVLAVSFLGAFVIFRGLYGVVAFLFALGLSAVLAYLALHLYLLLTTGELSVQGFRLKRDGRWLPSAYVFLVLAGFVGAYGAHAATVQFDAVRTQQRILTVLPAIERDLAAGRASPERIEQAIELYGELVRRDPRNVRPALTLGLLLTARERYAEARAVYERGLAVHPDDALLLTNYGVLEASQGKLGEAVGRFSAAVRVAPSLPQPRAALAEALAKLGRWQQAAAQYERLVALAPGDVETRLKLSCCYARLDMHEKAAEQLEQARLRAPERSDISDALQSTRALLAERQRDARKARP